MLSQAKLDVQISRLKWQIAAENCRNVLRRYLLQVKYDPNQPRDEIGRWTSEGGDALTQKILAIAKQMKLAASPASYQKCLSICSPILERPKPYRWSDINRYDFIRCMSACMQGRP
jgi:hypothetical protein